MPYVYKLTNKINNTIYIGKSINVVRRMKSHITASKGGKEIYGGHCLTVDLAIAKYGFKNFELEIIHETKTEDEAYILEEQEIKSNKENNVRSYNIGGGGKSNSGWHHSKETLEVLSTCKTYEQRLAACMKNPKILTTPLSVESRRKAAQSNTGKKRSQSMKDKNSINKRGVNNPFVKLNEAQVNQIILIINQKINDKEIALIYNVHKDTIRNIRTGKTWRYITRE